MCVCVCVVVVVVVVVGEAGAAARCALGAGHGSAALGSSTRRVLVFLHGQMLAPVLGRFPVEFVESLLGGGVPFGLGILEGRLALMPHVTRARGGVGTHQHRNQRQRRGAPGSSKANGGYRRQRGGGGGGRGRMGKATEAAGLTAVGSGVARSWGTRTLAARADRRGTGGREGGRDGGAGAVGGHRRRAQEGQKRRAAAHAAAGHAGGVLTVSLSFCVAIASQLSGLILPDSMRSLNKASRPNSMHQLSTDVPPLLMRDTLFSSACLRISLKASPRLRSMATVSAVRFRCVPADRVGVGVPRHV